MTNRAYYAAPIQDFLRLNPNEILGILSQNNPFSSERPQQIAWAIQIQVLKEALAGIQDAYLLLEYSIPRLGRRVDAILLFRNAVFVLEFKVGESAFPKHAIDQAMDYGLDLKYFHAPSRWVPIFPILIATEAKHVPTFQPRRYEDLLYAPSLSSKISLRRLLDQSLDLHTELLVDFDEWVQGLYSPAPTIVEAAVALYASHQVENISRKDASVKNLNRTVKEVANIIQHSKENKKKSICFITGVPGAGKTLVGLEIANKANRSSKQPDSVFLSGNGPLVKVLRAALTEDRLAYSREIKDRKTKVEISKQVESFIQNVHHFRDDCIRNQGTPPVEHIAIFDEAQRAWDIEQTKKFMLQKKGISSFKYSEPGFLISCMDYHNDWSVIICLVGGGQEINTGEAGIRQWIEAIQEHFNNWNVYISPHLQDQEYDVQDLLIPGTIGNLDIQYRDDLHLSVSMRSFRSENVSLFVKLMLDLEVQQAQSCLAQLCSNYPIHLTRDLETAKKWLRSKARGSERVGIVASSKAKRLRPLSIDVSLEIQPAHWFLSPKTDVRSSSFLEEVATEFHIQGLELDWVCVAWDADFQYDGDAWNYRKFTGTSWKRIASEQAKKYLKNAYRVLLTRARQGMVIFVPEGHKEDATRLPKTYDATFQYLQDLGIPLLPPPQKNP